MIRIGDRLCVVLGAASVKLGVDQTTSSSAVVGLGTDGVCF